MDRPILLGCGIFQKEIRMLQEKNGWDVDTHFLPSSLHINFNKLSTALTGALGEHKSRDCRVFYGACHPLMDEMLEEAHTFRTKGVNCVEMLLGEELYMEELEAGAFFLLEDWTLHWNEVIPATFGGNMEAVRQIFQMDRKYILAIRTPVSGDFSREAKEAAQQVGLPLRFMDVTLERLEKVLNEVLKGRQQEMTCQP